MQSQLSCPLCNFQYGEQKTPRILSMCGHTFCEACIETMILAQGEDKFKIVCPQDDISSELQNNTIKQFPINRALMKIIDSNKSKSSFKDSSFDVSKIVRQQQLQQDQQTKQLISAIKESQNQQSQLAQKQQVKAEQEGQKPEQKNQQPKEQPKEQQKNQHIQKQDEEESQQDDNMCLLHQKPLEIVCVVDLQKICAKCAIFGKHKGHDFKSIEEIQKQNNDFYANLIAVYDQKTEILSRVEKKQTKPDIIAILNTNKQAMSKQIKERFKKLIDVIKGEQKKSLNKLQKICQKIEKDIDDLYNIDASLVQKYEEWQKLSYQKLQIIQKGSFEEKLQLLLVDQAKKEKNLITQGKTLIENIKNQQDRIINKAEVMLTNFNMKTNDQIFQFTQNFVQIYDKPPQVAKAEDIVKLAQKIQAQNFQQSLIDNSGKKNSEDDLLEVEQQQTLKEPFYQKQPQFGQIQIQSLKKIQFVRHEEPKYTANFESKTFQQKSILRHDIRKNTQPLPHQKKVSLMAPESTFHSVLKEDSFISDKVVRPTKKKLKSIKVPEKYEKVLESLYADTLQTFDLTNAQLGDNIILQLCEFIPGTKLKTIKFIRNKLTDDCIVKMLPYLANIITLNLSQNLLTERVLDIFIEHRQMLPKVKNIILSLNKIIERKHKGKIDELRKLDIVVSV